VTAAQESCRCRFQLQPFASARGFESFIFYGVLDRLPGVLTLDFRLEGDLQSIAWPTPSLSPIALRRHELWQQTCFELFFAIPGDSTYWEVNLSPDGSWNVYRFRAYRQGMEEEQRISRLPSQSFLQATSFILSCRIDLSPLVPDAAELEVAVAGVVRGMEGATGYWAIDHVEAKPDFSQPAEFSAVAGRGCS
jgi:hypothetical protein